MTSFMGNILSNNLFENCVNDSFLSLNCILGSSTFAVSVLIIGFNCYAFYKLITYFHKVNFETSLILLNIIQTVIIQLLIITSYEILLECFNLVQIAMLTWIIRKFNILLKNPLKSCKKNILFIVLNIINISLIIFYIVLLFLEDFKEYHYETILFHTSFSLFTSCLLVVYSRSLIRKIKKINNKERDTFQIVFDSKDESNNEILINKNNDESNKIKELEFYDKRENQIKPLYKINLICSFFEFLFIVSVCIVPNINFQQDSNKIVPESVMSHIFYYLFILVCIINTFTNFFCFFWRIKSQYKINPGTRNTVISNNFLRRQQFIIENERNEAAQIEQIIENDFIKREFNHKDNRDFVISFGDITIDNQNSNNMNQSKEREGDYIDEKKENENKEFLKDNEIKNRESIPMELDSQNGINRISRNTMSIIDEDK